MVYSPWGHKELDMTEQLSMHACSESKNRMVVRVRVIPPVIMGLTGFCPTQHHYRGSDCMLLAGEKIKVRSTVFTESISLLHYHKVEKLLSRGPSVWPKDSKGPLPLFVNKELLEYSHAHSVHIVPSCFPTLLCQQS